MRRKVFSLGSFVLAIIFSVFCFVSCGVNNTVTKYEITWKNDDGSILHVEEVVEGEIPVYPGEMPSKEGAIEYSYIFTGWTPLVVPATEDAEYTATYTTMNNNAHTVKIVVNNAEYGNVNEGEYEVEYVPIMHDTIKAYREDSYLNLDAYPSQYHAERIDYTKPLSVKFDWEKMLDGKTYSEYMFYLSQNENFSSAKVYTTKNTSIEINNLFAGTTYYWKVSANGWESAVKAIRTDDCAPRFIDVDGVTNMRDLGGYYVGDNQVIKQGLLYRSANADNISQVGIQTANEALGIKTEIDLRNSSEGMREDGVGNSYFGDTLNYFGVPIGSNPTDTENIPYLQRLFKILSNKDNYPIVYHCVIGADRTGFVSYILNALLGVEKDDLFDDYQITSFANQNTYRPYKNINDYVHKIDAKAGNTLSEKVFNYLVEDKKIPTKHLIAFQEIMLETTEWSKGEFGSVAYVAEYAGAKIFADGNTIKIGDTFVTATPQEDELFNYKFDGWSGVVDTLSSNLTITANFSRTEKVAYTVNYYASNDNGDYNILIKTATGRVDEIGDIANIDFSDISTAVGDLNYVYSVINTEEVVITENEQVVNVYYKLVRKMDSFETLAKGAADKDRFGRLEGGNIYYEDGSVFGTAEVFTSGAKDGQRVVRYYIYNSTSVTLKATMLAELLADVGENDTVRLSFKWGRYNGAGSAVATITPYIGTSSGSQLAFESPEQTEWGTLTISGKELIQEFIASGGVIAFKVDLEGSFLYVHVYVDSFEVEKGEQNS